MSMTDEEIAKRLQAEFDEEYVTSRKREEEDFALAQSLVGMHEISDSDSEEVATAIASVKSATANTPKPALTAKEINSLFESDDDKTASEDDIELAKASIIRRKSLKSVPKASSRPMTATPKCEAKLHDVSSSENEEDNSKLPLPKPSGKPSPVKRNIESEDVRPLCKFAGSCYRKNREHLKKYRHTAAKNNNNMEDSSGSGDNVKRAKVDVGSSVTSDANNAAAINEYGILLTTAVGISEYHNKKDAIGIKGILSSKMGNLVASAQFSYMTDIQWLVQQYPAEFRSKPLVIVHGEQRESKKALMREASQFPHITLSQAKLEIPFGTHHTKMMMLLYEEGIRIVIHTANLVPSDWHQKTQGIWLSPVFPALPEENPPAKSDSPTNFKRDLLEYLMAYGTPELLQWCDHIKRHDFSTAKVYIIGSTPGRHIGAKKSAFGHFKLRKVLLESGPSQSDVGRDWPVIGQFSSIGSLGANPDAWLYSELLASFSATKGMLRDKSLPQLKLIFPSVDNVRMSLEGYPAGANLPYSRETAAKQPWLHNFFHQWKSESRGRSYASPHIKTYTRLSPDATSLAWFLVTSANLSKAAWGSLEKKGAQLMIRSYELGVLLLPEQFGKSSFVLQKDGAVQKGTFPHPYDIPLTPYSKSDEPWIWNAPHTQKPDRNGNMWCPS